MESDRIEQGLDHLEIIQEELEEIKQRTANPKRSFINGVMQGAGALVGGILALIFLGWFLSFLGVVPGLSDLANYLHSVVDGFNARH